MKAWWPGIPTGVGVKHPRDVDLLAELIAGGAVDRPLPDHVAACPACSARWRALATAIESDRAALAAAADAHFPADRLERQRRHVARRIERTPRAARVLRFPVTGVCDMPRRQVARRSIAAAALLGLTVGAVAGRLLDRRAAAPGAAGGPEVVAVSTVTAPDPNAETMAHAGVTADEAFLSELDRALASSRPAPLSALDALTPQVQGGR